MTQPITGVAFLPRKGKRVKAVALKATKEVDKAVRTARSHQHALAAEANVRVKTITEKPGTPSRRVLWVDPNGNRHFHATKGMRNGGIR